MKQFERLFSIIEAIYGVASKINLLHDNGTIENFKLMVKASFIGPLQPSQHGFYVRRKRYIDCMYPQLLSLVYGVSINPPRQDTYL